MVLTNSLPFIDSLKKEDLFGKVILLRVDFNVSIPSGKKAHISPFAKRKLKAAKETISWLRKQGSTIILATHLGRPQGKHQEATSTKQLIPSLQKILGIREIKFIDHFLGQNARKTIQHAKAKSVFLLENLRFFTEEGENDLAFAQSLASLADIYVNDAFSNSHRKHASMHKITSQIPSFAGLHVKTELKHLRFALQAKHPSVWILGGAKLDKIEFLKRALETADYVILAGTLPFPFLKAAGIPVGHSKSSVRAVQEAKQVLHSRKYAKLFAQKVLLPHDFLCSKSFPPTKKSKAILRKADKIENHEIALDIGPETISLYAKRLRSSRCIVWNGPLGYFESVEFSKGSKAIAKLLSQLPVVSICGGGETGEMLEQFKLAHKMSFVSTAGGASVEYLLGKRLIALDALCSSSAKKQRQKLQKKSGATRAKETHKKVTWHKMIRQKIGL